MQSGRGKSLPSENVAQHVSFASNQQIWRGVKLMTNGSDVI